MTIQLDETKIIYGLISVLGVALWFFFRHWMDVQEKKTDSLDQRKQDKTVCEVRHEQP